MKPPRFSALSAALLSVSLLLLLMGCASVRERLTPRSAAVIRVIQQIDAYDGDRPPAPRELGASGPATATTRVCTFRIDAGHRFSAWYPKGPPDAYSIRAIDDLIAGRESPPPPKPVKGPDPLDRRIIHGAVLTNSGRVIHSRDFESLWRARDFRGAGHAR